LQHFSYLANQNPINFWIVNRLAKTFIDMGTKMPEIMFEFFRSKLTFYQTQLLECLSNGENGIFLKKHYNLSIYLN